MKLQNEKYYNIEGETRQYRLTFKIKDIEIRAHNCVLVFKVSAPYALVKRVRNEVTFITPTNRYEDLSNISRSWIIRFFDNPDTDYKYKGLKLDQINSTFSNTFTVNAEHVKELIDKYYEQVMQIKGAFQESYNLYKKQVEYYKENSLPKETVKIVK